MADKKVIGRECKFVVYIPPPNDRSVDKHCIKEVVHYDDGTTEPTIRIIDNYKRDFYITKKGFQKHNDKKEWDELDRMNKYQSRECDLMKNVCRAIDFPNFKGNMKKLCRNPYIYGTDILSTAIIKHSYMEKYPECITPYTECTYDIETDMIEGHKHIIMATVSFGKRVFTAVHKEFIGDRMDVIKRLHEKLHKYLGRFIEERQIEWEVKLVDTEGEVVTECFKKIHEWRPDFLAIWNMNFDIPQTLEALKRANIRPEDVFSDPSIPFAYRFFNYKEGDDVKHNSDGTTKPLGFAERWHSVFCPSSFYVIDPMCVYRQLRNGSQEESSYALDAILDKEFADKPDIRKLKFKEAEGFEKGEWHSLMQANYKLEYVIYNVFDCVSMEILDEKINDIRSGFPMQCEWSDFKTFKSQPKRLADLLHFFALKRGKVMASVSDQMTNELDLETTSIRGWITTLPAHLVVENGLRYIIENQWVNTNIRVHVAD